MPPYIPGVNVREVIRLLRRLNFIESEGGNHTVFRHDRLGLATFVPRHRGDVDPVTMGSILVQIGVTRAELSRLAAGGGQIPNRLRSQFHQPESRGVGA